MNPPPSTAPNARYNADVQGKIRRHKSNNVYATGASKKSSPLSSPQYFQDLLQKLDEAHVKTSRMLEGRFRYILPDANNTATQSAVFRALQQQPMIVTNEDLSSVLKLELSTDVSAPTPEGHHFYVRSWALEPAELLHIIESLEDDDKEYDEMTAWHDVLKIHSKKATILTVRYIGTCQGPVRPIDRYHEDLRKRESGVLQAFVKKIEELYPAIADAPQVHLIKAASLDFVAPVNADDVERMLIGFFGHSTLLNRQRGGFYAAYVPSQEDLHNFQQLETNFYHEFQQTARIASVEVTRMVHQHYREIQEYANNNPYETGASRHTFSDELRSVLARAATPLRVFDYNLLLFVGKDITYQEYISGRTFIDGRSRAGSFARDFLRRLCGAENDRAGRPFDDASFAPEFFTFTDLWPTLWHRRPDRARQTLKDYFGIVQPLIVVTYSREVNGVVTGNFHDPGQLRGGVPISGMIGQPKIQYYGQTSEDRQDPDTAFINIPQYHPGHDKYTPGKVDLRRMYDLAYQVTFIVANEAMNVLRMSVVDKDKPTRLELCQEILRRVNKVRTSEIGSVIFENLEEVKTQLRVGMHNFELGSLPSGELLPRFDPEGRKLIESYGQLVAKPGSKARKAQVNQYWSENHGDLHVVIAHDEASRGQWIKDFVHAPEHQYFLLHAVRLMQDKRYLLDLLGNYRPAGYTDDGWLEDQDAIDQAAEQCGREPQRRHGQSYLNRVPGVEDVSRVTASTQQMEGLKVVVNISGLVRLRWVQEASENQAAAAVSYSHDLEFAAVTARTKVESEARFLSFTDQGIDIVDLDDKPFRASTTHGATVATLPRSAFMATKFGPRILELWRAVMVGLGRDPGPERMHAGKEWGDEKGLATVGWQASGEDPIQNRPPQPADGNYLLYMFLGEHMPEGGTFHTAPKDRVADSTEDMQAFIAFLKMPEWCQHPYAEEWLARLESSNKASSYLEKNMRPYRSVQKFRRSLDEKHIGKKVMRTWFEIGPTGTGTPAVSQAELDELKATRKAEKKEKTAENKRKRQGKEATECDAEEEEEKPKRKKQKQSPQAYSELASDPISVSEAEPPLRKDKSSKKSSVGKQSQSTPSKMSQHSDLPDDPIEEEDD